MAGMVGPSRSVQTKSLKPKVTVSSIFVKVVGKTIGHIYLQIKRLKPKEPEIQILGQEK